MEDTNGNMGPQDNDMFHTARGQMMKSDQKQIVTGLDKLENPESTDQSDQIFDSSVSRDINTGSVEDQGGITYKGLKKGSGGIFR